MRIFLQKWTFIFLLFLFIVQFISCSTDKFDTLVQQDVQYVQSYKGSILLGGVFQTIPENDSRELRVTLSERPEKDILVRFSTDKGLLLFDNKTELEILFTPANYSLEQIVTVDAPGDKNTQNENVLIKIEENGKSAFSFASLIQDADQMNILFDGPVSINEGGTGRLGVRLSHIPLETVDVTLTNLNPELLQLSKVNLTFTPSNYEVYQYVTLDGLIDADGTSQYAIIKATADGIPDASNLISVLDKDISIVINSDRVLLEGSTVDFRVKLSGNPGKTVTMSITSSESDALSMSNSLLVFNELNYSSYQTVTVQHIAGQNVTSNDILIEIFPDNNLIVSGALYLKFTRSLLLDEPTIVINPTADVPNKMILADINNNGKKDLIVISDGEDTLLSSDEADENYLNDPTNYNNGATGDRITIYRNISSTSLGIRFSSTVTQINPIGKYPDFIGAEDINGDGKPDLLLITSDSEESIDEIPELKDYFELSSANYATFCQVGSPAYPYCTESLGSDYFTVYLNGTEFNSSTFVLTPSYFNRDLQEVNNFIRSKDLNSDGLPDLIFAESSKDTISYTLNQSTGGQPVAFSFGTDWSNVNRIAVGNNNYGIDVADLNGDGLVDLVVAAMSSDKLYVILNSGIPTNPDFSGTPIPLAVQDQPWWVFARDLNNDGKNDLVNINYGIGGPSVSVFQNTSENGIFSLGTRSDYSVPVYSKHLQVVDLNQDGLLDLLVAAEKSNKFLVFLNVSTEEKVAFSTAFTYETGASPVAVIAEDMDGDGDIDILVLNAADKTIQAFKSLKNN